MDSQEGKDKDTGMEEVQAIVDSADLGGSGNGEAKFDVTINTFICKNILSFLLYQTPCISFLHK